MSEAKELHDDLMRALLSVAPRTTYQNIHRLSTLAWAVIGLCLTRTVRLGAWAEVLESRAQSAASRVRSFSRWLHQPAIHPHQWYAPVLQVVLGDWPHNTRVYVALDTTVLTPFVLIRASLIYRGRAIPLAWRAMQHRSAKVAFEYYQPVLEQVHAIMPAGHRITLLADRGFVHEQLLHYLHTQQWHFRLRLMGNTLVHLPDLTVSAVRGLCPPAGEKRFFHEVALLGTAVGPAHLALACPLDHPDDPWYVASDELTTIRTLQEYGLRFDIEETFLDEKSGGFQLQTSELATPEALERLLLIVAIAILHLTSVGAGVVQAGKHRWVDTHWDRGISYLKLGWRWQRQQHQRGWQTFAPFWLDPLPDPLPARASRRTPVGKNNHADFPMAG